MKNINYRIKQALENSALNQLEFSKKINKTETTVSRWVNGKTLPRRAEFDIIAKVLHVSKIWLEFGEGEMLRSKVPDCVVNKQETPYTSTKIKSEDVKEKIITLQQKLIEATENLVKTKDELIECRSDFIASQKKVLELKTENEFLKNKYKNENTYAPIYISTNHESKRT